MLKGQDILVLLKLMSADGSPTVRGLAADLALDPGTVHRALARLREARLVRGRRPEANLLGAEEFLLHGLRYIFPAQEGGPTRGIPTAWAVPPLSDILAPSNELPPVWPDAFGDVRGNAVEPIHSSAIHAAGSDPQMQRLLGLVDALRLDFPRIRILAADELKSALNADHAPTR